MNIVTLVGRLTKSPEVKTTQSQKEYCSFSIAVDRKFKNANGEREADFINCVAWNQQAKLLGQYFQKGSRIGIVGSLQTRNYENSEGKKIYVTEVSVEAIEFIDSKKDETPKAPPIAEPAFYPAMEDDTSLPFDL